MAKTSSSSIDRLGKLILAYGGVTAMLLPAVGGVVLLLAGIGALLFDRANPQHGGLYNLLGWVLIVAGLGIALWGIFQGLRSFEVRRGGVRSLYLVAGRKTELTWDDIVEVEVRQHAAGGVSVNTVDRRSGRVLDSRSLRHHYTITITSTGGDVIDLTKNFLQMGGQPKKLIEALRRGAREKFFFMDE